MIYMENKCLSIKFYECLMLLENNIIEIKMKNNILRVTGEDLEIRYYSDQEVIIYGKIDCLKFI
ncbi:YabP/YqfC family sporulation protein [Thomasclavelia saccharogumia]|uniref:YabP/YqfC family sporulation protein n=1 Tax=Thomasclavelia saccharogumia TaxID=341225 RepID=UPI00047AF91A|nr:YabP/YqfC family sporulation protein [Thomasclavelia saccharogumia]